MSDPPLKVVRSHVEAMQWANDGLTRLQQLGSETKPTLIKKLCDRTITTSSAFSGVGSPETSDLFIEAAVAQLSSLDPGTTPLKFEGEWALEFDGPCQEELLAAQQPPQHLFVNILDVCPERYRKMCGP